MQHSGSDPSTRLYTPSLGTMQRSQAALPSCSIGSVVDKKKQTNKQTNKQTVASQLCVEVTNAVLTFSLTLCMMSVMQECEICREEPER